jgi:TolB protein
MELTRGVAGAIPIAVVPFAQTESAEQNVSQIINNDLQNSGRFKVFGQNALNQFPSDASKVSAEYFRGLGTDNVLVGKVSPLGGGQYQISFQLLDMFRGAGSASVTLSKNYTVPASELRAVSHHISDLVYEKLTGTPGIFSTKIAYVVVQRSGPQPRHLLEVSDQDGYNPKPLLNSSEPVMSPAWSPDRRQIAYVSFENRQASIIVQDVASGARRVVSRYPGINGAPAWSPDGRKLALVLSKNGSPNVYVMDLASRGLTQITNDSNINTEPSWSPDGRRLLFTSNRGGGPQIYQYSFGTRAISRLSYDGDYNARASYTRDGKYVVMIHRVSGVFYIALLNLDTGTTQVLSSSAADSASPSIAPNGTMILYDTVYSGNNELAMVSSDGRVQLRLPSRNGEAQDPAWSPL